MQQQPQYVLQQEQEQRLKSQIQIHQEKDQAKRDAHHAVGTCN